MQETDFYKAGDEVFKTVADYWSTDQEQPHGHITREYVLEQLARDRDALAPFVDYTTYNDEQLRQQFVEFYWLEGM